MLMYSRRLFQSLFKINSKIKLNIPSNHIKYHSTKMDNTNKVLEHSQFFADQNGKLTPDLMIQRHNELGIPNTKLKASAIMSLLKRNKCPFSAQGISVIENPASTGIWNTDGTFNEQEFQKLTIQSIPDVNNELAITRQMFNHMIGVKPGSGNIASYAWLYSVLPIPLTWNRISHASVDELFTYFSDTYVMQDNIQLPAITVKHLRYFYTEPKAFLDSYIKRSSPDSPPGDGQSLDLD